MPHAGQTGQAGLNGPYLLGRADGIKRESQARQCQAPRPLGAVPSRSGTAAAAEWIHRVAAGRRVVKMIQ